MPPNKLFPIFFIFCLMINTSCNSERKPLEIIPVDGYFSKIRPQYPTFSVLNKAIFDENFGAAATMNRMPTEINFESQKVLAIVLPETSYSTEIRIDSTYIEDKILHLHYSIEKGEEEQSFTIVPTKIIAIETATVFDVVSFNSKSSSQKIEIK